MFSPKRLTAISLVIVIIISSLLIITLGQDLFARDQKPSPTPITLFTGASIADSFAASPSANDSITIVTISAERGSLLANATYLVTPNPFTGQGNFTAADNSDGDSDRAFGIISLAGAKDGNYTATQVTAPDGNAVDPVSKMVAVTAEQVATVTFTNVLTSAEPFSTKVKSITYTAKFHCGSIEGGEGPLRPGRYDTDISILNNEKNSAIILWNAIIEHGVATNAILKTLEPESSTDIVCKDLYQLFSSDGKFISGFVVIRLPIEGTLGSLPPDDGGVVLNEVSSGIFDPLEVQVFYTANALATLPHPVYVDKIIFSILNDPSGKIPPSMLKKILDLTVESTLNEISEPEIKVKNAISTQYGLSDQELDSLTVRVRSVSVGVGSMIDDHAISLLRVPPQASG